MAAKDKTERGFRLLWDTDDLSGDLVPGSVGGGGFVFNEADLTGVSEAIKNYLAGHPNSTISARFHMNDTLATGAFTLLHPELGLAKVLEMRYGSEGAAPINGDLKWSGTYVMLRCALVVDAGRVLLDTLFQPGSSTPPAWGVVAGL